MEPLLTKEEYDVVRKVSTTIYGKLVRFEYEAYRKSVGVDEKEPEPEYEVGEIVHWDGTDGRGNKWGELQIGKIIKSNCEVGYSYGIEYLDGSDYWNCDSPALRPLTEEELAKYYTVELGGVRCRFYKDKDGDVLLIHKDKYIRYIGISKENAKITTAILKKAGIPIMSFADSAGDYKPPKASHVTDDKTYAMGGSDVD